MKKLAALFSFPNSPTASPSSSIVHSSSTPTPPTYPTEQIRLQNRLSPTPSKLPFSSTSNSVSSASSASYASGGSSLQINTNVASGALQASEAMPFASSRTHVSSSVPQATRGSPVIETKELKKSIDAVSGIKTINNYQIVKELGRGVHGKVKLARNIDTQQLVAIKILRKERPRGRRLISTSASSSAQAMNAPFSQLVQENKAQANRPIPDGPLPDSNAPSTSYIYFNPQIEKIQKEIAILKKCRHPNIVQLYEVIDSPNSKKVYIVLEYLAGGELVWQVQNKPCLDLESVRLIFRDVVVGLEYLHTQGIIHRDIKPANLLMTETGAVKLSDFGVSYFSQQQYEREQRILSTRRASIQRSSPRSFFSSPKSFERPPLITTTLETPDTEQQHDEELVKTVGSPAFFAPELCFLHDDGHALPKQSVTKSIDVWALGVTLYCLCFGVCPFTAESEYKLFEVIPNQPLSFPSDIQVPPDLADLLQRILTKDPEQRPTLDQIKRHPWTLEGLSNPEQWLLDTDPIIYETVEVTDEDVKLAFTDMVVKLKHRLRKLSSTFQGLALMPHNRLRSQSLPSVTLIVPPPFSLPKDSYVPTASARPSTRSPPPPPIPLPDPSSQHAMIFPLSPLDEPRDIDMELDHSGSMELDSELIERQRRSTWENEMGLPYETEEEDEEMLQDPLFPGHFESYKTIDDDGKECDPPS